MWLHRGDWLGLHNTHKPSTWGFTTLTNPVPEASQHPLLEVSPLETIWASPWGPIWALHLRLRHGDHHNNIASTPTNPSQPPPLPVWGFTTTQHTHKSITHKSKPTHHPKSILRNHHHRSWVSLQHNTPINPQPTNQNRPTTPNRSFASTNP